MIDQLKAWWKRFRALTRPDTVDREMTDEMAFHLEMEETKNRQAGMTPAAARRAARIRFGATEGFKEEVRASRGIAAIEELVRNLRHAARDLRRAPGFATVATLTLGLGIGAATTIFSAVDAVVLAPPPFAEPDRLVYVWETNPEGSDFVASEPNYLDFRDRNRSFATLAAYQPGGGMTLSGASGPRLLSTAAATHNLFPTLGIGPAIGRGFGPDDDQPGTPGRVVILSHRGWQTFFGGDSGTVGQTVRLDGEPHTILGVMPAAFRFLGVDAWVPLAPDARSDRDNHWLGLIGRLRPGATIEGAQADLARITVENGASYPVVVGWGIRVVDLAEWMVGKSFRQSGVLLLAAVGILLLLACANVANLLLARATARQTDLSLRLALGAGQGRLVRQLLTESGMLAILGAGVGLLATWWAVATIRGLPSAAVPRLELVAINGRVLGFALGAAVLACLGVGLLPALQAARTDLHSSLKHAGRGAAAPRGTGRAREWLVIGQVALAVVLLVGGGLMIQSLVRLQRVDTGLETTNVWTAPIQLPPGQYDQDWKLLRFYHGVAERVEAIPGIRSAGWTAVDPYRGTNLVNDVTPEERAAEHPTSGFLSAAWRIVSPGYFDAAGVSLLAGRDFSDEDRADGVPVAIVSKTLADRSWPNQDPIGRRLYWGGTDGTPRTVIGVVSDVQDHTLAADPPPMMFLSTRQITWPSMTLIVQTNGPVRDMGTELRRAIWAEDPGIPVPMVRPLAEGRAGDIAGPRFTTSLLAAFAVVSLLLAGLGLYGVLAFAVVERTREIGVRIALGARPAEVVAMLIRRGLVLTGGGLLLGLGAAAVLTRLMTGLLYRTAGTDPVTLLLAPLVLGAVAAFAGYIPASRATRVDPVTALRGE